MVVGDERVNELRAYLENSSEKTRIRLSRLLVASLEPITRKELVKYGIFDYDLKKVSYWRNLEKPLVKTGLLMRTKGARNKPVEYQTNTRRIFELHDKYLKLSPNERKVRDEILLTSKEAIASLIKRRPALLEEYNFGILMAISPSLVIFSPILISIYLLQNFHRELSFQKNMPDSIKNRLLAVPKKNENLTIIQKIIFNTITLELTEISEKDSIEEAEEYFADLFKTLGLDRMPRIRPPSTSILRHIVDKINKMTRDSRKTTIFSFKFKEEEGFHGQIGLVMAFGKQNPDYEMIHKVRKQPDEATRFFDTLTSFIHDYLSRQRGIS